jgi:branched-chain amino acid transport system substrate-binding protein
MALSWKGALRLALAAALAFGAGAGEAAAAAKVQVGLLVPLSGPWARQGQVMREGAELAVADINAQGGIAALGGTELELAVFDTGDSVERAKNAAQRMVAEAPDLVAACGSFLSSFTLAVTEVTERAALPVLTLSYSDQITERGFNYVFQSSATGATQAAQALPVLVQLAEDASGARPKTVAIIKDNTAASLAFVRPMKAGGLDALGLELVVDETFTPPLANATPLVQRLRAARPDLLLLLPTVISDAKLLLEKMNEFGLGRGRLPTISNGTAIADPDLLNTMNVALLEGVMSIVANWGAKGQEDLIARFKKSSGEPWMIQNPLSTYGHIWIVKQALETAGVADRRAVADAIRDMDLSDGPAAYFPGHRVAWDEKGRRRDAGLLVVQWQGGEPVTVYPPESAVATPLWPKR